MKVVKKPAPFCEIPVLLAIWQRQPQFNIAVASEEDIKLFLQTMNYEKELCYEKDEFVEGIELVSSYMLMTLQISVYS